MAIVVRNIIRRRRMRERLAQQQQAAANAAQQQQAAKAAAEAQAKQAEQQAITNASAITDSGRQTDIVNNTTEAPVANTGQTTNRPKSTTDDLEIYINDMRNRRRNRGAALPQLSGVLGQVGALGI